VALAGPESANRIAWFEWTNRQVSPWRPFGHKALEVVHIIDSELSLAVCGKSTGVLRTEQLNETVACSVIS
jgi:hypothetical protein